MPRSRRRRRPEPSRPAPPPQPKPGPLALLVPAGVALLLLLVYLRTLLPTMVDQDSGELVAAVHVQGIPHPTGYPLWLLLGRLFDLLPIGHTSAYRVGLASAVPAATAGGVIALLALSLTGRAFPAAVAGLAFGLWFPCWSQAVRAEVYALGALLFALCLLALRKWNRERAPQALIWLALTCGLVSMHHRTSFLAIAPAFLGAFLLTPPRCRGAYFALAWLAAASLAVSRQSHLAMALVGGVFLAMAAYALIRRACLRTYVAVDAVFLAPFVLYLYLWARALQQPPMNWTNPVTLDRLIYHALAKQYFFLALSHTPDQMIEQAVKLLPQLLAPEAWLSVVLVALGLPLAAWGWSAWRRREPLVAWSLAVGSVLLCVWVLQWGETSDLKVFLHPLGAVAALCGAVGLAELGAVISARRLPRALPLALGLLLCAALVRANWQRSDLSNRWGHRDRWAAVLSQLAPDAIFISDFDVPSFATLYLQNVERMRQDVTLIRSVRLPTSLQPERWYLNLIEDSVLRDAVAEAWRAAQSLAPEVHEQTAAFAYLLAKRLPDRPIYTVHGPMLGPLQPPPYFVGLSEDLVQLASSPPDTARRQQPTAPVASFPGGISLAAFRLDRSQARTGDMLGFTAQWQLSSPLPPLQFAVALVPEGAWHPRTASDDARLLQPFPLCHGIWGLAPSEPGTVYEQRGHMIVPTNALPGRYRVAVSIAPLYSTAYQDWVEVGELTITRRPLPRNGP